MLIIEIETVNGMRCIFRCGLAVGDFIGNIWTLLANQFLSICPFLRFSLLPRRHRLDCESNENTANFHFARIFECFSEGHIVYVWVLSSIGLSFRFDLKYKNMNGVLIKSCHKLQRTNIHIEAAKMTAIPVSRVEHLKYMREMCLQKLGVHGECGCCFWFFCSSSLCCQPNLSINFFFPTTT